MEEDDFDGKMDFDGMEEDDFDGKMDFDGMEEYDFDGKMDFDGMEEYDEENRLEPTGESDISQEPDRDTNADNNDDQSSSLEQENESYENLNSESTSTVLICENREEEEGENLQNDDQGQEEIEEINQEELEKEIEKELEEGVEAINHYLEEEAEFINAYQEMVGEARELDGERENEGEERLKTEEEWEKEVETAAYTAEQIYEGLNKEDNDNEKITEQNEELEIGKEAEHGEEVLEPQLDDLQEELDVERDEVEQHQVEPLIEEAVETEPEPVVNEKEIEELQEMDLEEQFQAVHEKESIEELVEWQSEKTEQKIEEEVETQLDNSEEIISELEEEFEVGMNEVEQHQLEPLMEEALETIPDPMVNDKEIEELQELDLEEQFQTVHDKEYIEELVEQQEEEKIQEHDKIEQEQEILHQSTHLQEQLEEQELEYEEKDEVEQHQVEATIEEELETEPKPIIHEEELEYIKNFEPEEQLDAELLYELIEELANKQNEEQEEISTEEKVAQLLRKLEIVQEINTSEKEVELDGQEGELEPDTTFHFKEAEEHAEEENRDHQQELEEILEQNRKIEQEALNEIKQKDEDSDKTIEKNYEEAKKLYKQQTGKRPIYANQETKGFKQWLEQKKESKEKKKTKYKQDLKEEQKKEEVWKWTLKNRIEEATEIEPELKSELKKLVEKYNELEKLIKKYSQLYKKAQRKELSQVEKNELKSLIKVLQKLDPIKTELFIGIREIKQYIDEQYYYDFWNKQRHNQVFSHFFTLLSQKYSSLKQLQKKKNFAEKVLKNWIEDVSEEEISSELKAELKELIENYNELEPVAIMFMKLYTKAQSETLSKTEQKELHSLVRTFQNIDPSKIELFTKIRAIKHYLNDKISDDLSNQTQINRLLSRFFAQFEQISFNTRDLIEDLRNEIQILSEELALMFPNRLMTKKGNQYSDTLLSRLWAGNEHFIKYQLRLARTDSDYIIKEDSLLQLQKELEEGLGAKALGCIQIIRRYQNSETNTLQFVDLLEKELGRVSGEIMVTDAELGLILVGTKSFIKVAIARITQPLNRRYNPNYKFSRERLDQFKTFLFEIFGDRAQKCFDMIQRYKDVNTDLKEYSQQQYKVKNPLYFHSIENNPKASYWFGFLRADGSRSGRPYQISIELAVKDKERLERFAEAINLPIDRIKFRTRYMWYKRVLRGFKSATLKFICNPMAKQIDDLGFLSSEGKRDLVPNYVVEALKKAKKTSKQKHIDWWLATPGQVALAFLLGFYDGDGTYLRGRSTRIYSRNKDFLEHVKELFKIKNKIILEKAPGEDIWVFDQKYISKGFYSLALGPKLFDMMMNSYENSMIRKRSQSPAESLNFLGDQT